MKPKKEKMLWIGVDDLIALKRNPQYCTPGQMDALKNSIVKDGFVSPILVRKMRGGKYEIVSGNHRVIAAREIGLSEIPCITVAMTAETAKRMAMNLNTIHGDPNPELVAPFLAEMDDATLLDIHLEESMIQDIVKFDEELHEKLKNLQLPASLDNESSKNLPTCKCSKCGRLHIPKTDDK